MQSRFFSWITLKPAVVYEIVKGMASACKILDCPLIGGETAEMPGVYLDGENDVVGFMVGVVERQKLLDSSKVKAGDTLIALASNGLHTNGFSLARKVLFEDSKLKATDYIDSLGCTLGEELLKVHKSYTNSVFPLFSSQSVHGIAHITGGGIMENLLRVIPEDLTVVCDLKSVNVPLIFSFIQELGKIPDSEMYRVFNMGIGLVLIVDSRDEKKVLSFLSSKGEVAWVLGKVEKKK